MKEKESNTQGKMEIIQNEGSVFQGDINADRGIVVGGKYTRGSITKSN